MMAILKKIFGLIVHQAVPPEISREENLWIICRRGDWLIFSVRCKEKEADEHGQKR
jgi:hypothetical protein